MQIYIILLLKAMEVNQLLHHFKSVIQYFKSSGISLYLMFFPHWLQVDEILTNEEVSDGDGRILPGAVVIVT